MSTTTPTIPAGYREDAHGRLVPEANIKPIDLLRDSLVRELCETARKRNAELRELRLRMFAEIQAFAQLSAETYGAQIGGKKGNLTLTTFDGRLKIVRAISNQLVFDERLQAAKHLIDACLNEWSQDARPELRTIITDAFNVDQEGNINTARVLQLRRMDIKDERWLRAMEAISDSLRVSVSKSYIRIYERRGESDEYDQLNLDLSAA